MSRIPQFRTNRARMQSTCQQRRRAREQLTLCSCTRCRCRASLAARTFATRSECSERSWRQDLDQGMGHRCWIPPCTAYKSLAQKMSTNLDQLSVILNNPCTYNVTHARMHIRTLANKTWQLWQISLFIWNLI